MSFHLLRQLLQLCRSSHLKLHSSGRYHHYHPRQLLTSLPLYFLLEALRSRQGFTSALTELENLARRSETPETTLSNHQLCLLRHYYAIPNAIALQLTNSSLHA